MCAYAHPIWTFWAPTETLDFETIAGVTGVAFTELVALLRGTEKGAWMGERGKHTFLRRRQVLEEMNGRGDKGRRREGDGPAAAFACGGGARGVHVVWGEDGRAGIQGSGGRGGVVGRETRGGGVAGIGMPER